MSTQTYTSLSSYGGHRALPSLINRLLSGLYSYGRLAAAEILVMSPILPQAVARETRSGPLVIALHCSGSTGRQWQSLTGALADTVAVVAPDFIGTPDMGHWCGRSPFSLAAEAAPILALIDSSRGPIHLVGHSYGGGVALHVATLRSSRIASLALYEPSAFHLLPDM